MKRHPLLVEVEAFLARHLPNERKLTRSTILSYRDTLKLYLKFCAGRRDGATYELDMISYESVLQFLAELESKRQCSVSTRNQRLAAIKSFCNYVLLRRPEISASMSRVLAIPFKKDSRRVRHFLEEKEIKTFLSCCKGPRWVDRRNTIMFDFAIQTGVRVSELINLRPDNIVLTKNPFVKIAGKGRKERVVPLSKSLAKQLSGWLESLRKMETSFAFPTQQSTAMSSDAVQLALKKIFDAAKKQLRSLKSKHITVHSLRHTAAMRMLNHGVDIYIIALWLGHERIETTQLYLSESLALKRKALKRLPLNKNSPKVTEKISPVDFLDEL